MPPPAADQRPPNNAVTITTDTLFIIASGRSLVPRLHSPVRRYGRKWVGLCQLCIVSVQIHCLGTETRPSSTHDPTWPRVPCVEVLSASPLCGGLSRPRDGATGQTMSREQLSRFDATLQGLSTRARSCNTPRDRPAVASLRSLLRTCSDAPDLSWRGTLWGRK